MLYLVIERFKDGDAVPVYRRFRDQGRMTPEGLDYVSSWVDTSLERCFQIMETADPALIEQWAGNWSDLVEFEIIPVISSRDAMQAVESRL